MKNLILVIALVISGSVSAQLSINAGGSMLMGFGNKTPWGGFHIGLEVPRDDAVSIFGRFTHHFKQRVTDSISALDYMLYVEETTPTGVNTQFIGAMPSMNYNIIEGGTRYYLGNGFDYGFAAYGGSSIMVVFSGVKGNYQSFDESKYSLSESSRFEGSVFSVGFGLGGGVKYSFDRLGTLYLDFNLAYMIFNQPSNAYLGFYVEDLWRPLIFNFNVGFRKDIIW